ncbi:MAG: FAD-binding protein [Christensenellales bacterium]
MAVIGGGARGMMAALQAAWVGGRVALLERTKNWARKSISRAKDAAT